MLERIKQAAAEGDSVGGEVECAVVGVSAGKGGPMSGSVESRLSQLLFAVSGGKGGVFRSRGSFCADEGQRS